MKVRMHGEADLTVSGFDEPIIEVEADDGVEAPWSALQMFATSLGLCTASVLTAYGERIGVPAEDLSVRIRWHYTEQPVRVDRIDVRIRWPGLPESRREAARRAASQCSIHNTLRQPPDIETRVNE